MSYVFLGINLLSNQTINPIGEFYQRQNELVLN
jgi:hypothetical protein